MANPQARTVQKAVIAALSGLGDDDIPSGLSKAAKILADAGIAPAEPPEAPAPEPGSRTLRHGRHRMETGGSDRGE